MSSIENASRQLKEYGEKNPRSTITNEQLLANGWKKEDPVTPMAIFSKKISVPDEDSNEEEEGTIEMVLHSMFNTPVFAVCLPDGSLLNINPASMEELNAFEQMILGYIPNF